MNEFDGIHSEQDWGVDEKFSIEGMGA